MSSASLIHIKFAIVEDLHDEVRPAVLGGLDEGRRAVVIEASVRVNAIVAQEQLDNLEMR